MALGGNSSTHARKHMHIHIKGIKTHRSDVRDQGGSTLRLTHMSLSILQEQTLLK